MSVLGFSIVGDPKITFIFIFGSPNPRKGALREGGGFGAYRGCCVLYYQISCVMSILVVLIVGNQKITFIFIL